MSLRFKLFLPPFILLMLMVAVLHFYWLPSYNRHAEQTIVTDQEHTLHTLSAAVLPLLLVGSQADLYALLDAQRQLHTEWQQLVLYDPDGQRLYPLEQPGGMKPQWQVLSQVIESKTEAVGKLDAFIDTDALVAENSFLITTLTDILLGIILILVFVVGWWQEYLVRRPLNQLSKAASSMADGDFSAALPADGKDEIGQLAASFSSMRDKINSIHWQLKNDANLEANRAQVIMDNVIDAIITIDPQGVIASFNAAAEWMFGYQRDEIIGQNVSLLMPERNRNHYDGYLRRYCGTDKKTIIGEERELQAQHKDGTVFPVVLSLNVVSTDGGVVFFGIIRDISQRKQAEAKLEMRRRQIETINSAQTRFISGGDPIKFFKGILPDILALTESEYGFIGGAVSDPSDELYLKVYALTNMAWDEETRALYEENAAHGLEFRNLNNLFGHVILSGGQVISNDPANDPHSGGLPEGHPPLNTFLGVPVYLGERLLGMIGLANRPGGYDESVAESLQPIMNTCAQIFNANNKDRLRRSRDLELKRSNSFMTTLVENLQAGLLVEDEVGKVYALNQTYCDMFGKDELPLMIEGGDCENEFELNQALFSQSEAFLQWRQECLSGAKTITGKEWLLSDGRVFEQDYIPIFFEDEQGLIHRSHLWSYRDISEHKQIQKTLGQAKEAAEAAATAKSQFLATMSHEIRTPMNGLLGMLHLLGKSELDTLQRRYLNTAAGSGEMLIKVINDILDFSKLEADKVELESIPFELVPLLEESVSLLFMGAQEKGVELLYSIVPNLPRTLKGDPTRLRQVLINLINNAIKFTEQGDIVVYATRLGNGRIRFGVRDTGIGMTDEQQQRLFKAFSQVDSSHTRKYGGTGLGLAISQKLIMAMGGKIRVASAPGLGSDFSFDLSLEVVADSKPAQHIPEGLTSQRVLVVDDNETLRTLVKRMLRQVAHTGVAMNGSEALEQLRAAAAAGEPYDIAILDLMMPGMDGLELARAIRSDSALQGMKLMMFTGIEPLDVVPEVDAWMTKPLRQSELFNTLLQMLGEQTEKVGDTQLHEENREWWFGGSKLLLVEDNHINQEVARELLGTAGFDIDIRDNGAEALQAVQANDYDVVLMDIQMPVMDGLAATEQIRALGGRHTRLPIIAMTAHALGGDGEKSLAAGMNGHLTKPIDPAELFRELAQWLEPGQGFPAAKAETLALPTASLPELPGIDVADGLQRLNGNGAAYKRILRGFRDKQADSAEKMKQLIDQGEWDEAARLAHTLKGSGGNLGAKQLYKTAAVMEQACRAGDADAAEAGFGLLHASLAQVIDGLAVLAAQDQVVQTTLPPSDFDPSSVRVSLNELLQLLDSDLGAAQDRLVSLQRQVVDSDYAASLKELENALNSFDIEAAKVVIQGLQMG